MRNFTIGAMTVGAAVLTGCVTTGPASLSSPASVSKPPAVALAFQANPKFGDGLSALDRARLSEAEIQALDYGRTGQEIDWKGSNPGAGGSVIAYQPYKVGQASCRRFQHELNAKQPSEKTSGTACKRPNGDWRLVQ